MNELAAFWIIAVSLILTGFGVILVRNPVTSAFFLIANLFLVACLYALQGAHFAAAIQVLVYAGAIMVLFLFVIMLLNLHPEDLKHRNLGLPEVAISSFFIVAMVGVGLFLVTSGRFDDVLGVLGQAKVVASNTYDVGLQLFVKYVWPFELASFLIMLAIVASVLIAKKDKGSSQSNHKSQ